MVSTLEEWLKLLVEKQGSDLFLSTGAIPSIKVDGKLFPISNLASLKKGQVYEILKKMTHSKQLQEFNNKWELNFGYSLPNIGRFRVNAFQQRSETTMVFRRIPSEIPSPEILKLPHIMKDLMMKKRGLILFVGATGSGKSTSLASLIDYRNQNSADHMITIEDPIEFTHRHQKSIINQREIGIDTQSYEEALKNALRQAPDVILIGEIRTREAMEQAIIFSETGHLCLSTLHASNANQAITRITNFFPKETQSQFLLDLSFNLRAIISQRLVPAKNLKLVAAVEIMINTPLIAELIKRGEIKDMKEIMHKSGNLGMQTFDAALFKLYQENLISEETAIEYADSQNNIKIQIALDRGISATEINSDLSLKSDNDLSLYLKAIEKRKPAKAGFPKNNNDKKV